MKTVTCRHSRCCQGKAVILFLIGMEQFAWPQKFICKPQSQKVPCTTYDGYAQQDSLQQTVKWQEYLLPSRCTTVVSVVTCYRDRWEGLGAIFPSPPKVYKLRYSTSILSKPAVYNVSLASGPQKIGTVQVPLLFALINTLQYTISNTK